jgi:hypothetical protein
MGISSSRGGIGQLSLLFTRYLHRLSLGRQERRKGQGRERRLLRRSLRTSPTSHSLMIASTKRTQLNGSSLSPTQLLESKATGPLRGSRAMQQRAMKRLSALNAPIQVIEAKAEEDSVDVPVEAVASVIVSGANSIQRDNQGLPQRSSSVSPSSPSFNLPPIYRACAIASPQSCSRADSGRIWNIPSYPPSEIFSGAWHCYLHECPHYC